MNGVWVASNRIACAVLCVYAHYYGILRWSPTVTDAFQNNLFNGPRLHISNQKKNIQKQQQQQQHPTKLQWKESEMGSSINDRLRICVYSHSINPKQNDKQIIIEIAAFIFNNYKWSDSFFFGTNAFIIRMGCQLGCNVLVVFYGLMCVCVFVCVEFFFRAFRLLFVFACRGRLLIWLKRCAAISVDTRDERNSNNNSF